MINPLDKATWPSGDKIWDFCRAIAIAEGYGVDLHNTPTSHHNPGDLSPQDTGYPGEFHGGSTVSQMPNDEAGWSALRHKLNRIVEGKSNTFSLEMTFVQFAHKYAEDWQPWVDNVCRELKVTRSTRLMEWFYSTGIDEATDTKSV
jgi:hypothetical protein